MCRVLITNLTFVKRNASAKKEKVPCQAVVNGLQLVNVPEELSEYS